MIRHPPRSPLFPYRTLSRSKVHVRCARSDYNILGLPAEEFPAPPDVTPTAAFTLPGETLRDMIRHVLFAVSTEDRKSTRLNSSHANISYAVFCLKKKKITKL